MILSLALLAGCAGWGAATRERRAQEIPQQRIFTGMREERVWQRSGRPIRTVGARIYPDGTMEVRHYVVNM